MKQEDIIDNSNISIKTNRYKELILWWEKKRIYYNLLMLLVMSFVLYEQASFGRVIDWTKDISWGLFFLFGANLFYTLGWIMALPLIYLKWSDQPIIGGRWLLLGLGSLFSVFWMLMIYTEAVIFL